MRWAQALISGGNGLMAFGCLLLLLPLMGFFVFALFVFLGKTGSILLLMLAVGLIVFATAGKPS